MTEGDVFVCLSTYDGWQVLRQEKGAGWSGLAVPVLSVRVHNLPCSVKKPHVCMDGRRRRRAQLDKNGLLILKTYSYAFHLFNIHFTIFLLDATKCKALGPTVKLRNEYHRLEIQFIGRVLT